ncbi:MAG: hypothetical protein ACP5N1_06840 [Candidatus Woesearchaeota archaeon]
MNKTLEFITKNIKKYDALVYRLTNNEEKDLFETLEKIKITPFFKEHPELKDCVKLYSDDTSKQTMMSADIGEFSIGAYLLQKNSEIQTKTEEKISIKKDADDLIKELQIKSKTLENEKIDFEKRLSGTKSDIEIRAYTSRIDELKKQIKINTDYLNETKKNNFHNIEAIANDIDSLKISKKYPVLDLKFLNSIRTEGNNTYPKFSVQNYFTDKTAEYSKTIHNHYPTREMTKTTLNISSYTILHSYLNVLLKELPQQLDHEFLDSGYSECSTHIKIQSALSCVIPESTKKKIRKAEKIFGKEIYLIYEAKKWTKEITIMKNDPLVVGIKHSQAYLIDLFDPTPLEKMVVDNYRSDSGARN